MAEDPIRAAREARVRMARGALEGIVRAGEDLLGAAVNQAPIEEGTLRGSAALTLIVNGTRFEGAGAKGAALAAVTAAVRAGRKVSIDAEVSFNTIYAARQHEELGWAHPLGGNAKYLERPLRDNAARYQRVIALSAERGA